MSFDVRFILVRPRAAENLGAAARALKNFGLGRWTWVSPRAELDHAARRMAVQSEDVLEGAERCDSLEQAVKDAVWVVATSSRTLPGRQRLTPEEFAKEAVGRLSAGPVALVFGDERSGLRNKEIRLCHDLSFIPTDAGQPSVNLAQSVLLYAYELGRARRAQEPRPEDALPRAATHEDVRTVRRALELALKAHGFLRDEGRLGLDELLAPLLRARLSRHEAELWRAALHALRKGGEGKVAK